MGLQSICDEILLKKEGRQVKKLSERRKSQLPFLTRDLLLINNNNNSTSDSEDPLTITTTSTALSNSKEENSVFEQVITNDDL